MQTRIIMHSCLALLWFVLAVIIFFHVLDRWLGQAEDWKRYLAMSLALVMGLLRASQVYKLLQLKKRREMSDGPSL
jgi:hypothetical protein